MIPSDHFVRFYNEVFKYIVAKGPGEIRKYYDRVSKNQEYHCLDWFREKGLRGMYEYWEHIRVEENCDMANHFEDDYDEAEMSPEVRDNRRLLYETMINAGFTNLPSEWWHYDYGTKFWGYFTGKKALYKGILTHNLPDRFPLT